MSKPKILLCGDDINLPSGVGTMSKSIIENTMDDFTWVQLGGSQNHPFHGQYKDMDNGVRIYGANRYGDRQLFKSVVDKEQPDGILFFTDPRHFEEHFNCEYDIRQRIPYMYYNIWDNYPIPKYNYPFYKSSDGLFCISKVTKDIVEKTLGDEKNEKVIDYVPHGVDPDLFTPIDRNEISKKKVLDIFEGFDPREYQFVVLWSNKNMERKRPMDMMLAFDKFIEENDLYEYDACLIMHTNPKAKSGTDLYRFKYDNIKHQDNIYFSENGSLEREEMNYLYNIADVVVCNSDNEGWGLALTEAMMTAVPIIATSIGGMQDQMMYGDRGEYGEWAFPLHVDSNNLIGNNTTPYIYESRVNIDQLKDRLTETFNYTYEELTELGMKGREYAIEAGHTDEEMAEKMKRSINKTLENFKPRENLKISKIC